MLIVIIAIISFIAYKTEIPLSAILGMIFEERYVSNVLGGLYFGTQVCTSGKKTLKL